MLYLLLEFSDSCDSITSQVQRSTVDHPYVWTGGLAGTIKKSGLLFLDITLVAETADYPLLRPSIMVDVGVEGIGMFVEQ